MDQLQDPKYVTRTQQHAWFSEKQIKVLKKNHGIKQPGAYKIYVTEDGTETDLDLGHYERFIDVNLSSKNTTSSGRVYWDVLERERRGD